MSNAPRYRLVGYDIGTAPDENGGWVHWTDHEAEIARLTAERDAALVGAVKVKPLVWEKLGDRAWRAPSPFFGSFRVECYGGGPWRALWSVPGLCDTFVDGDFAGPDDAKQAIDARILAAIQPDPDARQEALAPTDYERKLAQMKRDFPNGI